MTAELIYVGIDDTDMPDTPGTNQLARELISHVADGFRCRLVLRHQLLFDPRVPYTSKNGSASIWFEPIGPPPSSLDPLICVLRERMLAWYIPGSDPGLCVATTVPSEISDWGLRAQRDLLTKDEAYQLAKQHNIYLEGLGGTCGGVIGALAAVGLAKTRNDGRVVVHGAWPDDLSGPTSVTQVTSRGIAVQSIQTQATIAEGTVDVGKHLRPNFRRGQVVLFVEPAESDQAEWRAVRLL